MTLTAISVREFLKQTSSSAPTPGGGGIAALTAATAAALASMVGELTKHKKGYESVQSQMDDLIAKAIALRDQALQFIDDDATVFNAFMEALRLPKDTDEQKKVRQSALQEAYRQAAMVPLQIAELSYALFDLAEIAVQHGNKSVITDGAMVAINARAAVKAAILNVRINLSGIKDVDYVQSVEAKLEQLAHDLDERENNILAHIVL